MEIIELTCENCNTQFERRLTEHKRNMRVGRQVFCSRSCHRIHWNKHHSNGGDQSNLLQGRELDQYSQFRKFMRSFNKRNKEVNITLEDLKAQWEKQNGKCAISGLDMLLPKHSGDNQYANSPWIASVDRIDSNKGYVKGNIQFVCHIANLAKHNFHSDDLLKFCKAVSNF